jgi:hypothetical protein
VERSSLGSSYKSSLALARGMSSKAVAKDAMEEGGPSRREGLRVDVDETTDRKSESLSRFVRVDSLVRRRRLSSSLSFGADEPLSLLPVNLLHMMLKQSKGARVRED